MTNYTLVTAYPWAYDFDRYATIQAVINLLLVIMILIVLLIAIGKPKDK